MKPYIQYYLCILINNTFTIGGEMGQRAIITIPFPPCNFFLLLERVIHQMPFYTIYTEYFLQHLSQEDVK